MTRLLEKPADAPDAAAPLRSMWLMVVIFLGMIVFVVSGGWTLFPSDPAVKGLGLLMMRLGFLLLTSLTTFNVIRAVWYQAVHNRWVGILYVFGDGSNRYVATFFGRFVGMSIPTFPGAEIELQLVKNPQPVNQQLTRAKWILRVGSLTVRFRTLFLPSPQYLEEFKRRMGRLVLILETETTLEDS